MKEGTLLGMSLFGCTFPRPIQVESFLRAYFGPISFIGAKKNSPEIVVTERDGPSGLAGLAT